MHGLIILDKPAGITSREAVDRVKKVLLQKTRIGHAGTLDPLATGVLVLCIGDATRLTEYVQRMEKEYVTDMILGATSTTDDADGDITPAPNAPIPTREHIEEELKNLTGAVSQVPPAYSAAKVSGKRAHALARKGQSIQLQAKQVQIHEIELLKHEYPLLSLRIRCGKGTYIRSIARDLGQTLGCGGYVQTLRRTRIGPFHEREAVSGDHIDRSVIERMQPLEKAVSELPALEVDHEKVRKLQQGQKLLLVRPASGAWAGEVAVFCGGRLCAIARINPQEKTLSPVKVLSHQELSS